MSGEERAAPRGAPLGVDEGRVAPGHTVSSLGRARQIAQVLAHHELWSLVEALDLGRFVPVHHGGHAVHHGGQGDPGDATTRARSAHLRLALEELGPTFMKLGQMLSTRADLLPPAYQAELAKLQDAAPAVPIARVRATITAELGHPPEDAFATFEATPLAAASIGQAHLATLHDGTPVVVKVRRPGAVEQIDEDLKLLHRLADVASRRWEGARAYDLVGLAREFDQSLRAELDYLREGRNTERVARNRAGDAAVHIPRVFWETTTSRVLTQERIVGLKVTDVAALDAAGIDRAALAMRAARLVLTMVFEDGFFHADLHPGNLFIEEGGRIGLIDFGMVGMVDTRTRETLGLLLVAVTRQDAVGVADTLLALGAAGQPVDRAALGRDLAPLLTRYDGQPLTAIAVGPLLAEALGIMRRHHLVLPSDLALLLKTVVTSEGMGARLDPSFHLLAALTPYAGQLLHKENSPQAWMERLGRAGPDMAWLVAEGPGSLRRLLDGLERGSVKIGVQPTGIDPVLRRLERVANRVVLGVIAAAFIIGLGVLMAVYHPGGSLQVVGTFFAVGFAVAVALSLFLAWSIVRSGRG